MKAKFIKTSLITILLTVVSFPQDSDRLIQLIPEFGDTIDANEMRDIGLINLKNFKGFQHLVFYNRDDKFLVTKITSKNGDSEIKDSTIISDLQVLNNIRFSLERKEHAYIDALNRGKYVNITTIDGQIYSGVIANVNDSSLMLLSRKSLIESDPEYNQVAKKYFEKPNISTVSIEGESNVGTGILTGALGGIIIGSLIGLADGDDTQGWIRLSAGQRAVMAGAALGVTGTVVGLILGLLSSSSDERIIITDDYDLNELNKYISY